jgi:tRNA modification GTPase
MKTIVALATPPLNCAIHIIRVSGPNAFNILNKITSDRITKIGYSIQLTKIVDKDNKLVDQVIVNKFVSPKSYTGENVIEINCHGSYFIANKIIQLLISHGCKQASRGEFTQQALLNKKLNIIQAESINNLVNSCSDITLELANLGFNSKTKTMLLELKQMLFNLIGKIEVNIDYPEYDENKLTEKDILTKLNLIINKINKVINNSKRVLPITEGINVSIVGKPNVGKSSLLNALLNDKRAIVSSTPGTTRDAISEKISINGININILDTAGIHNTHNNIEKQGIEQTKKIINKSHLVLFICDITNITKEDIKIEKLLNNKIYLKVLNKSDLTKKTKKGILVSAKNGEINSLLVAIKKTFHNLKINNNELIMQSNFSLGKMELVLNLLEEVKQNILSDFTSDLVVNSLHKSLNELLTLLGESNDFNFIDELFSKFCIGK